MKTLLLGGIAGRMILFFVALVVVVQLALFVSISVRSGQIAQLTADHQLEVGERGFERLWAQNSTQLEQEAAVLTADYGLREALATNNRSTILSVLGNHASRAGASASTGASPAGR